MTIQPDTTGVANVYLNPGDFHFLGRAPGSPQPARLRTLLGSCVSMILWHPERHLAGMSHAILPTRSRRDNGSALEGRYCDEAVALFSREIIRAGALPQQFHVYLVGGGQMYLTERPGQSIGDRNIEAARIHLKQMGFSIRGEHVGMSCYRKVEFDLRSGEVTVTFANKQIKFAAAHLYSI